VLCLVYFKRFRNTSNKISIIKIVSASNSTILILLERQTLLVDIWIKGTLVLYLCSSQQIKKVPTAFVSKSQTQISSRLYHDLVERRCMNNCTGPHFCNYLWVISNVYLRWCVKFLMISIFLIPPCVPPHYRQKRFTLIIKTHEPPICLSKCYILLEPINRRTGYY
jgi:hypothetical protein